MGDSVQVIVLLTRRITPLVTVIAMVDTSLQVAAIARTLAKQVETVQVQGQNVVRLRIATPVHTLRAAFAPVAKLSTIPWSECWHDRHARVTILHSPLSLTTYTFL